MRRLFHHRVVYPLLIALSVMALDATHPARVSGQEGTRAVSVSGKKYAFDPAVIEVRRNDLVKVTLRAEDVAHSFTIDEYRIDKRASPGRPTTFEFRADKAGTFPFYCNIKSDSGCRQMRGTLIVRER
jgi:heme/copper-type cytochrome/quinol oxidase subunit 2